VARPQRKGEDRSVLEAYEEFVFGTDGDYFNLGLKAKLAILSSLCEMLAASPVFTERMRSRMQDQTFYHANDRRCCKCERADETEDIMMVKCSVCPGVYHLHCVEPTLRRYPNPPWQCPPCAIRRRLPSWFLREVPPKPIRVHRESTVTYINENGESVSILDPTFVPHVEPPPDNVDPFDLELESGSGVSGGRWLEPMDAPQHFLGVDCQGN
jgi:hypothetical protein